MSVLPTRSAMVAAVESSRPSAFEDASSDAVFRMIVSFLPVEVQIADEDIQLKLLISWSGTETRSGPGAWNMGPARKPTNCYRKT
jgi:hypothetical protein